jgi:hypothetical protein
MVFEMSWYNPALWFSHFVCIRHHFIVRAWCTAQSILSVVVGQCWWLLSSRWPILVAKADGLPMVFSGCGCGPTRSTIFFTIVGLKSLRETLEHRISRECGCSEVEEVKERFLLPFPRTVIYRIANGYSLTFVDVAHVSIVVLHSGRLKGFSSLITKFNFCWWIMNLSAVAHHICPSNYCCNVATCHDPNISAFQSVSCFWSCLAYSLV